MIMAEPIKQPRINIVLPVDLHRDLRLKCIRDGIDLKDLVPMLLRKALAQDAADPPAE